MEKTHQLHWGNTWQLDPVLCSKEHCALIFCWSEPFCMCTMLHKLLQFSQISNWPSQCHVKVTPSCGSFSLCHITSSRCCCMSTVDVTEWVQSLERGSVKMLLRLNCNSVDVVRWMQLKCVSMHTACGCRNGLHESLGYAWLSRLVVAHSAMVALAPME